MENRADVRVNNLESNVYVSDARAMLRGDHLIQLAEAVRALLREEDELRRERERDMEIDRRAVELA